MGAHEDVEAASAEDDDDILQFQEAATDDLAGDATYDGVDLDECIEALTADDPEIRARAADALLDVPAGGALSGQRGTPWAYAVVAAGALIPLLGLVQRVRRDGRDGLKPKPTEDCPENTAAVVAGGDAALLVLAEIANAASSFLQEEGWDVAYDEDTDRPIFVDENSGMSQSTPPRLEAARGDWVIGVAIETLTLIQPLSVDETTREPRWPVRVLRHVHGDPSPIEGAGTRRASKSVLDIAVEEGEKDARTRVLVKGAWRGSQSDAEGEIDPAEAPGAALDSWRDATVFASLVLGLRDHEVSPNTPRVLILGLRCGVLPAFLRRMLPGVALDVVEPDAAVARAARDFFHSDFHEEPWNELTPFGFEVRIKRTPSIGKTAGYRVWSGVEFETFARALPATDSKMFAAVIGDLPDLFVAGQAPFFEALADFALDPDRSVVALAASWIPTSRRFFWEACDAAAAAFGDEATAAACDPDEVADEDDDGEEKVETSRPSKRVKTDARERRTSGAGRGRFFGKTRGRAGVVIAGIGAAAPLPSWDAYSDAARKLFSAGILAEPSPFAVDVAENAGGDGDGDSVSAVWNVSYRASEERTTDAVAAAAERAAKATASAEANAENDAWGVFEDDANLTKDTRASPNRSTLRVPFKSDAGEIDVCDAKYWTEILGTKVCGGVDSVDRFGEASAARDPARSSGDSSEIVRREGYFVGDVVVPSEVTETLVQAISNARENGWPPAVAFLSDAAWLATRLLWTRAESMLNPRGRADPRDEVVLEPSLAAFALDPAADKAGRRYVGNNFGAPHRDYASKDVRRGTGSGSKPESELELEPEPSSPDVLSVWLPLVDVTPRNGCVYVVPIRHDARDDSSPPAFDRAGAVALAPAPAGSLLAWAGDTVHWGTACAPAEKLLEGERPRVSLAFVFRKKNAACDARGTPLTKRECFENGGLSLPRRLEIVRHALTCFEHWYGDTKETRDRLTPR